MSIQQDMRNGIKAAMIAKDAVRLTVLRGLVSAFTNESVAKGKTPQDELADEDAVAVIKRAVKQRKDSIDQFTKGNRLDLVVNEEAELKILETFLPQTMSKDDIKVAMEEFIKESPRSWLEILTEFKEQAYPKVYQAFGELRHKLGRMADDRPTYPYAFAD